MEGHSFVTPEALYAQQVAQASGGALPAAGMAPYPLYGIGQAASEPEVPFYRRNWFWAAVGAGTVGAAWAYFGWWSRREVKSNPDGLDPSEIGSVLTVEERRDCAELWGKEPRDLTAAERRRLREYERKLRRSPY